MDAPLPDLAPEFETKAAKSDDPEAARAWRHVGMCMLPLGLPKALKHARQNARFTASKTKAGVYRKAAGIIAAQLGEADLEVFPEPEAREQASLAFA